MVLTMPGVLLVVNPQASAVTDERAERVASVFRPDVEVVQTQRRGHATDLVRDPEGRAVVVFGGDGAFNEALNGIPDGVPIGFVPGGGSSVLPRALGLPSDPEAAAERIAAAIGEGRTRSISLGRVNGRRFGFAAGLGLPAEVVRRVDERGRGDGRRAPDRAFLGSLVRILAERRGRLEEQLEIGGRGRAAFALVANGDPYTYYGRFPVHLAPEARWERGLDLVAPRVVRPGAIPGLATAALTGRVPKARNVLYLHDLDEIELRADRPLPLQVDGEDLGDVELAEFSSEREAANVLT
jgi:diacylglycerol kinase family enzyme